jgi:hypothetical protein
VNYESITALLAERGTCEIPKLDYFSGIISRFGMKNPEGAYSVISLATGHCSWPIPLEPLSMEKTAFRVPDGSLWEWTVLPFDFPDSRETMHVTLEGELKTLKGVNWAVRISEILVYSPTVDVHLKDTKKVFELLHGRNLKPNWEKCKFSFPCKSQK